MIAVVTDSASMFPPSWLARWDVLVAPLTVVLDGAPFKEGVELSTAEFYRRLAAGAEVTTSAPSPGDLLTTYRSAVAAGARHIVAVHTGSAYSAVLAAAGTAAEECPVPVELVDTATVSFPVALCVAAACEARDQGVEVSATATAARAMATAARAIAGVVDSVFIVGAPELARRGGRFGDAAPEDGTTTILGLGPGGFVDLGATTGIDDAISQMADHVRSAATGRSLRVGVGDADRPDLGTRLSDALGGVTGVDELVRYEVGPSVGAHSGPGTVGAVWAPR